MNFSVKIFVNFATKKNLSVDLAVTLLELGGKGGSTAMILNKYRQKNVKIPPYCQFSTRYLIFNFGSGLAVLCGSMSSVIGSELTVCDVNWSGLTVIGGSTASLNGSEVGCI